MSFELKPGASVPLHQLADPVPDMLRIGCGWIIERPDNFFKRLFTKTAEVDLDLSCVMYDEAGEVFDTVWYVHLISRDGSVKHFGDQVEADDDPTSDEEKILINLEKIPPEVDDLVFVISSFSGENFDEVEDAYIQVEDHKSGQTFARFDVYPKGSDIGKTAAIMLRLSRDGAGDAVSSPDQWYLTPIGDLTQGKTIQDLYPEITPHLPGKADEGGQ